MRMRVPRRFCFWALALLLPLPALMATPLKGPKRLINEQTVDLPPLFHWWTRHEGARPLAAWVHITGSITATNAMGWVVTAQVEDTGRPARSPAANTRGGAEHIILRNPPLQDLVEFERLTAQLHALNHQHDEVEHVEHTAENAGQGHHHAHKQAAQAKAVETEAKAEIKPLDQQIQDLKHKLGEYPSAERYEVDCLALDVSQVYQGLPVYDHGTALK